MMHVWLSTCWKAETITAVNPLHALECFCCYVQTDPVLMSLKDGYHRPNQLVFKAPVKEKKSMVVNGIDLLENVPPRTENEVGRGLMLGSCQFRSLHGVWLVEKRCLLSFNTTVVKPWSNVLNPNRPSGAAQIRLVLLGSFQACMC